MRNIRRYLATGLVFGAMLTACGRSSIEPAGDSSSVEPPVYAARALRDITVPRTPERVARGEYLAEGLLQCFACHSERDWTQPGAPPVAGKKGAGAAWPGRPWLVAPNLTPDRDTGIGRWTDDMLLRAIREGISHDGRVLHKQMWYGAFRALPDADAEAVVAYLRSLKPIRHALPATVIPAEEAKGLEVPEPIVAPVVWAPAGDAIQRGRRLAALADCAGWHTSWDTPENPGLYGGGNQIRRGDRSSFSSNLTSDPSGIPHYDEAIFREVLRTGRVKGRDLSPLMPWTVFRHLDDDDLNALFAYLRAVTPVKHVVDNIDAPSTCAICGGAHPLGQYNRPRELKLVDYPLSLVRDAVGTYRFEDGFELRTAIANGVFQLKAPDGSGCRLVSEDRQTFFCEGDIDRLEFIRTPGGTVTHVVNNRTDIGVFQPKAPLR
jgi:mono/diheme cytochrome c family protein